MHCFNVKHFILNGLPPDRKVVVLNLHTVELVPNKVVYVIFYGIIALKTGLVRIKLTPRKKGHRNIQCLIQSIVVGIKVICKSTVVDSHILVDQIL